MKQYKKLLSFGCSMTKGVGLDDPRYHAVIQGNYSDEIDYDSDIPSEKLDEYKEYALEYSFPGYLAELLNCNVENHGVASGSNELIIKNTFDVCDKLTQAECADTIITVQFSILSRMFLYHNESNRSFTISGLNQYNSVIGDYYERYIKHFYNKEFETDKLKRNVKLLQTWLQAKNIDAVFIKYENFEEEYDNLFCNFPSDDRSLSHFLVENKLRISDIPNMPYTDYHATEYGNERIAEIIFKYIKELR